MALLKQQVADLDVWEYGARLTSYLQKQGRSIGSQEDLRSLSAKVALPSDITALDDELLEWTKTRRLHGHVAIDSHPVTKEQYGFRVTAFSAERFKKLGPDEIWLFYVSPEVTLERIATASGGRPAITIEEARIHSAAQASVACTFAIAVGCPVYMFDTDVPQEELVGILASRLNSESQA
ncbi:adenylate kinase [Xanthobacter flavus]|nr:adenylate kinase [Xanthobacter flavus]